MGAVEMALRAASTERRRAYEELRRSTAFGTTGGEISGEITRKRRQVYVALLL